MTTLTATKERASEIRNSLRNLLNVNLSVRTIRVKGSDIFTVVAPKNQENLFTDEQTISLINFFKGINAVDCLYDSLNAADYKKFRFNPSFCILK